MAKARKGRRLRPGLRVDRSADASFSFVPRSPLALHLPVSSAPGLPASADPAAALLHGTAGLQLAGVLPVGLPADWAANDVLGPATGPVPIRARALTPRVWGKRRFLTRPPMTAVITGLARSNDEFIARSQPLIDLGVDVIRLEITPAQVNFNPVAAPFPLTGSTEISLGSVPASANLGAAFKAATVSALDPAGLVGGRTYWYYGGDQRMAFGSFMTSTFDQTTLPLGVQGEFQINGYCFTVKTVFDATDPGLPSMPGCDTLGSTDFFDGLFTQRFTTYFCRQVAVADAAIMAAYLPAFDRLRVAFWADEGTASLGLGLGLSASDINHGDPTSVAAAIDGGLNVVTYHPLPPTAAEWAEALVADIVAFFGP
jgi:hypothetical protein